MNLYCVMICRTEDFLDRMAISPQTGTSVEYTVCLFTSPSAGVSNSFGGAGHTARYHSVGGPHCF